MAGAPSQWLLDNLDVLPSGRRVLDIAAGHGRHALYLAERGWAVHAVDRDRDALAAIEATARGASGPVTTEIVDLETDTVSFGGGPFGAVLVFNYLHRPLMRAIVEAVAPGGVLVYETFTLQQALHGQPRNPAFLLGENELPELVAPLTVLRSREGQFEGAYRASIVALRPTMGDGGAASGRGPQE